MPNLERHRLPMVRIGIIGMDFSPEGITFSPMMPENLTSLELKHLPYRNATLHITIEGNGPRISEFTINGTKQEQPFLPANAEGEQQIRMVLGA